LLVSTLSVSAAILLILELCYTLLGTDSDFQRPTT